MKTKLFLIATLFITTIAFSQTARKGYTYYKNSSDLKMNKGELIDAMAKDANLRKRPGRTQGDPVPGIGIATKKENSKFTRKRPGRVKYNTSINNITEDNNGLYIRKRPGRTKYNK